MDKPTDLNQFRKKQRKARGNASTLCRRGFHKWQDSERKQFDVKQGKLVSEQVCRHCGARRTKVT